MPHPLRVATRTLAAAAGRALGEGAKHVQVLAGRFLSETDVEERARVAVLGQTTLNRLFAPDEEPMGATIRINGYPFRIVGILAPKGATPFGDEDDIAALPGCVGARHPHRDGR